MNFADLLYGDTESSPVQIILDRTRPKQHIFYIKRNYNFIDFSTTRMT